MKNKLDISYLPDKEYSKKHHRFQACNISVLFLFMVSLLFMSCKHKALRNENMVELLRVAQKNSNNPDNPFSPEAILQHADSIINTSAPTL